MSTKLPQTPLRIAVLPGDGIGREVVAAALPVLQALDVAHTLTLGRIGWDCWREGGNAVPEATWQLIDGSDAVLLGAITSKPPREAEAELEPSLQGLGLSYVSPVIQLRQRLDLYANLRPAWSILPTRTPFRLMVLRENTEGLYAGLDMQPLPAAMVELIRRELPRTELDPTDASAAIRLQSGRALRRLFHKAFTIAQNDAYGHVTLADKPNVLRKSGAFARTILEEVASAYPGIPFDIQNVDAVAMNLVRRPDRYGVIVAENMFGDILSDVAAATMGGLGLAPSANIGERAAYFEPVHGSAPSHAAKDRANPAATFLSIALMLDQQGYRREAATIRQAITSVVRQGQDLTYDLGGRGSTTAMAARIIEACIHPKEHRRVAFLSVGNELVRGEVVASNSAVMAKELLAHGAILSKHLVVGDDRSAIAAAIADLTASHEAVIIGGGLGPTSDDLTRESLADATGDDLIHDEASWEAIRTRLSSLGLVVHPDNARQALRPATAEVLANSRGTAPGLKMQVHGTLLYALPGPPAEALPMFRELVLPNLCEQHFSRTRSAQKLRFIGIAEADLAATVDGLAEELVAAGKLEQTSYRYHYPFVDVTIAGSSANAVADLVQTIQDAFPGAYLESAEASAIVQLASFIRSSGLTIKLDDTATGGLMRKNLSSCLSAISSGAAVNLRITGLTELAAGRNFGGQTRINLVVEQGGAIAVAEHSIPLRGPEVVVYATEWAAHQTLTALRRFAQTHAEDPA